MVVAVFVTEDITVTPAPKAGTETLVQAVFEPVIVTVAVEFCGMCVGVTLVTWAPLRIVKVRLGSMGLQTEGLATAPSPRRDKCLRPNPWAGSPAEKKSVSQERGSVRSVSAGDEPGTSRSPKATLHRSYLSRSLPQYRPTPRLSR